MTPRMMGLETGVSDDHAMLLEAFARSGLSVGTVVRFIQGENKASVDATPSVVGPAKRQRPRRPEGDPVPDREISPYTFSRVIDREMIGWIREVEAALAERDRDREDEEAEARFQKAARRFQDVYQNANAFEEGFEFVFEGKIWHFDTDNDGSLICFFNYAIVLTDPDAPTRNTDDDPDEGDTPTTIGETPSSVVQLRGGAVASTH
jgi:hypothetical protein